MCYNFTAIIGVLASTNSVGNLELSHNVMELC